MRVRHAWVRVTIGFTLLIVAAWLLSVGYSEWNITVSQKNFCDRGPGDFQQHFRYIQLTIDSQSSRIPVFDGHYLINLGREFGTTPFPLKIVQAAPHNWGASGFSPQFVWNDDHHALMLPQPAEISFVEENDISHYMFPFDSARFQETLSFDPPIDIRAVLFLNRVAGFHMPCDTITVRTSTGSANISFELKRNRLIIYTAVLLLVVAGLFAILITLFVEAGPLPGALASYFFAVWSIRALFGLTVESFPTLFDIGIILLVSFIPVLLLLRVLGLPHALVPVVRYVRNLVRMLEGRELLPAQTAENADT